MESQDEKDEMTMKLLSDKINDSGLGFKAPSLKSKGSTESSDDEEADPEVKFLSVSEAIDEAGGFGKFQFIFV